MIDFNTKKDYNLDKIKEESKISNLITMYNYRIYGLRQEKNPLILLNFNSNSIDGAFMERLKTLDAFFLANKLQFVAEDTEDGDKIYIGLRRDLRKNVMLSSSIVQTIIYCLENRLSKNWSSVKINKLPEFSETEYVVDIGVIEPKKEEVLA